VTCLKGGDQKASLKPLGFLTRNHYPVRQPGLGLAVSKRIVGLLELLKQFGLIRSGDARAGIPHRELFASALIAQDCRTRIDRLIDVCFTPKSGHGSARP
jgi:hypothetical protein